MASNLSNIDVQPHISQDYRLLTFNYDFVDKQQSRMCFSPPLNSGKSRELTMQRRSSRNYHPDTNISQGSLLKFVNHDVLTKAKHLVNEAILKKKIFTIYGPYDKIRQFLKSRHWVEKVTDVKAVMSLHVKLNKVPDLNNTSGDVPCKTTDREYTPKYASESHDQEEKIDAVASLLVLNCSADLIWSLRLTQIDDRTLKPNQTINHFKRAGSFTTKIGLIKSFNHLCWYEKNNDEVFPRSYILTDDNEKKAFLDDYYLTACMSLLKLTAQIKNSSSDQSNGDRVDVGAHIPVTVNIKDEINKVKPHINYLTKEVGESKFKIDRRYPEMAIHYCEFYLKYHSNKDLDQRQVVFCSPKRWEEFFQNYYYVTSEGYGIDCNESICERCIQICKELKEIHPQFNLDGTKNIWIVKPGAKSRGRGIFCASKFSDINDVVRTTSETLIVQKYIENPLLVYNTKFDIRQWFLVTSWSPLTIWWYNDSYLRFCSQQFTLSDFNESVHLSNNSIQHKYQNGTRSKHLPAHNMWEWRSLEKYLDENGYADGWKKNISPSMKDIIVDILLCSQEEIDDRKNSFELYGADFMVTAGDLKTWLLEINSSPCMAASTDVTARLTKSVLEDVMKVVLDYPDDVYCDTGQFELLYRQSPFSKPLVHCMDKLSISGIGIKKPVTLSQLVPKKSVVQEESSVLRHKLKQVADHYGAYRDIHRCKDIVKTVLDHRAHESGINQLSVDLKNKRITEYRNLNLDLEHRRVRSRPQEVMTRLSASVSRHEPARAYVSSLTHSMAVSELRKGSTQVLATTPHRPFAEASRSQIPPIQVVKKTTLDDTRDQPHKHTKYNDRNLSLRSSNDENSLLAKLTTWRQMDKSQRSLPRFLLLHRRVS